MRLAAALTLPQSLGDEPAPQGLGADLDPFLLEFLGGEGGAEALVAVASGFQGFAPQGVVRLVVGRLAAQAVDDGPVAAGLELAL